MPQLAGLRQPVSRRAPAKTSAHEAKGWMVSGYFAGSISASASAVAVTHPAYTFTRGKTALSRTRVRTPARASRQAAVLPPGPPPTTIAWYGLTVRGVGRTGFAVPSVSPSRGAGARPAGASATPQPPT